MAKLRLKGYVHPDSFKDLKLKEDENPRNDNPKGFYLPRRMVGVWDKPFEKDIEVVLEVEHKKPS